ncbi:TetR/AcrR family transcriptional regulator [Rhizobacter sp. SG703]|uniref:TetR/AcrR family transcriptional regulator n=1 Tax=Rhizobacter sp. SG703 TaxID=2587140 RepID=UPI0014459EE9|nr:TetR/AcrR family transcriptional regulator [Rhizobacter sp. SG703]NKI93922.1 AcrR family transcriptional regulator [Rhizobacter sp. SG703]
MTATTTPRPGGRSARVQAAVHRATRELIELHGRAELTVPMIAARAEVTPSTIYRRWGDLGELLADVSVERMKPDAQPADTGSVAGDLLAWAQQFHEEMSSPVGLAMMKDVLSTEAHGEGTASCQCAQFTAAQIAVIFERGLARGEAVPPVQRAMDVVVAPIIYRALWGPVPADADAVAGWVGECLARGAVR